MANGAIVKTPDEFSTIRVDRAKDFLGKFSITNAEGERNQNHAHCVVQADRCRRARGRTSAHRDRLRRWWRQRSKIVIGTKYDQPGLGLKEPRRHHEPRIRRRRGEVRRQELGYNEDQIEWKESPSGQRET